MSTVYHTQTDDQIKIVNKSVELETLPICSEGIPSPSAQCKCQYEDSCILAL